MINTGTGLSAGFQRHLGLVIPAERVTFPANVSTSLVKIILPELDMVSIPVNRNLDSMIRILQESALFDEGSADVLFPLHDLRLAMEGNKKFISEAFDSLKQITEDHTKIGLDVDVDHEFLFNLSDYFKEMRSREFTNKILQFEPSATYKPSTTTTTQRSTTVSTTTTSTTTTPSFTYANMTGKITTIMNKKIKRSPIDISFRSKDQFVELIDIATGINNDLTLFATKLSKLVETLDNVKMGNVEGLEKDFFFKNLLQEKLGSSFRIIDVPFYQKSEDKFDFSLNMALFSGIVEYKKYVNVQYHNAKLANEYYSTLDSDEYFELFCVAEQMCYPHTTTCSRNLRNGTLYKIVAECPFVKSTLEFELVPQLGILINKEPVNEDIKNYLKKNKIEPESYPLLIQSNDCISFFDNTLKMCFKQDKSLVYSKFHSDIYFYLNPIWYARLMAYFQNVPLILFLSILTIIVTIVVFGVQKTRDLVKNGKQRFLLYLQKKIAKAEAEKEKEKEKEKQRQEGEGEASAPLKPSRSQSPAGKSKGEGGLFKGRGKRTV